MDKRDAKQLLVCLGGIWTSIVLAPMWLAILFGCVHSLGDAAPMWLWVVLVVYAPLHVLTSIVMVIAKQVIED